MLPEAKLQPLLKWGRGRPCKYLLFMAVADTAIIDTIIDTGAFTGNIADIADITIYLQDDDTVNTADTTIYLKNDNNTQFSALRQKEVTGLLKKGVFEIIKLYDILKGVRLFNSWFIDEIKNKGTDKAFEKSWLIIQAYNDLEKELILT